MTKKNYLPSFARRMYIVHDFNLSLGSVTCSRVLFVCFVFLFFLYWKSIAISRVSFSLIFYLFLFILVKFDSVLWSNMYLSLMFLSLFWEFHIWVKHFHPYSFLFSLHLLPWLSQIIGFFFKGMWLMYLEFLLAWDKEAKSCLN